MMGRRRIAGSPIGGIAETQEMLDFCAAHASLPDIEMIPMDQINEAFERMEKPTCATASSSTWRRCPARRSSAGDVQRTV